ncbi:hypothetical protein A966_13485 [Brachyspira hampsonii 30446]|uniref:Uncharacterized protein n=1 Tax=Brachyspira hampsonii 30446 TaxID=1289135 RepID=A0A2U4ETN5_9SPIR|nr:hypothetical protein A966_13485 [Brachyspira hampsonii 30446]
MPIHTNISHTINQPNLVAITFLSGNNAIAMNIALIGCKKGPITVRGDSKPLIKLDTISLLYIPL